MTIPQVAKWLNVADRTIYMWAQTGQIPAHKLMTTWRFDRRDIEAWIQSHSAKRMDRDAPWHEQVADCAERISDMMREGSQKFWFTSQFDHLGRASLVNAALDMLERRNECEKEVMEVRPGEKRMTIRPRRKD